MTIYFVVFLGVILGLTTMSAFRFILVVLLSQEMVVSEKYGKECLDTGVSLIVCVF